MIFANELAAVSAEETQLEQLLQALRQKKSFFQQIQGKAQEHIQGLSWVVGHAKENLGTDAIASLKTAVLTLFADGDGGNDDGGNQPTAPDDPTPRAEQPQTSNSSDFEGFKTDYAEQPQNFSPGSTIVDANGSYGIVIGTNNVGMSIDWLGLGELPNPASGKGCWYSWEKDNQAIASLKTAAHDQVKLFSTEEFLQFQNWEKDQLDDYDYWDNEWFDVGVGEKCKWGGATINRWIVVFTESCEWASPFASHLTCLLWEDGLFNGQHCTITLKATGDNENKNTSSEGEAMPYVELVKVNDAIAYQRKHDGEIICTYIGFRTKALAQSWKHFFEAITSSVELRQAKRLENCKWEIKSKNVSIKQIERFTTECDFTRSYQQQQTETPAQAAGVEPPSGWGKPQVKEELPPCPFGIGDIVDWKGCALRVGAIGVETLHCVLKSDPDGTRPHTKVPISECVLVEEGLDVGDKVEILSDRFMGVKGLEGIVNAILVTAEHPISVKLPNGNSRYFPRNELKFLAKAPTSQQPTLPVSLQTGSVLMGNRIVTSGDYFGQARANSINMARMGTATASDDYDF